MPSFTLYEASQFRRFLTEVDRHVPAAVAPVRLVTIGGSAAALGYGVETATSDVDTFQSDLRAITGAVERVAADMLRSLP